MGVGAGSEQRGSEREEGPRAGAWASSGEKGSPASGPPGAAGGTAAGRAGDRLHGRAVRVRRLWPLNHGDRLRRERAVGGRAGEGFPGGDQAGGKRRSKVRRACLTT